MSPSNQDLKVQLERIEKKLDIFADKHLEVDNRVTKNETDISWVKGSMKLSITSIITIVISLVTYIITGGK